MRGRLRQIAAFLVVGGLSAVVDAGVYALLVFLGVWPPLASGISFLSAFAVNYLGNRGFVFRSSRGHGAALPRYIALVAGNLVVSTGGIALLMAFDIGPLVAKFITMVVVAAVNFFVMRWWVFPAVPVPPAAPASEAAPD